MIRNNSLFFGFTCKPCENISGHALDLVGNSAAIDLVSGASISAGSTMSLTAAEQVDLRTVGASIQVSRDGDFQVTPLLLTPPKSFDYYSAAFEVIAK